MTSLTSLPGSADDDMSSTVERILVTKSRVVKYMFFPFSFSSTSFNVRAKVYSITFCFV